MRNVDPRYKVAMQLTEAARAAEYAGGGRGVHKTMTEEYDDIDATIVPGTKRSSDVGDRVRDMRRKKRRRKRDKPTVMVQRDEPSHDPDDWEDVDPRNATRFETVRVSEDIVKSVLESTPRPFRGGRRRQPSK